MNTIEELLTRVKNLKGRISGIDYQIDAYREVLLAIEKGANIESFVKKKLIDCDIKRKDLKSQIRLAKSKIKDALQKEEQA